MVARSFLNVFVRSALPRPVCAGRRQRGSHDNTIVPIRFVSWRYYDVVAPFLLLHGDHEETFCPVISGISIILSLLVVLSGISISIIFQAFRAEIRAGGAGSVHRVRRRKEG